MRGQLDEIPELERKLDSVYKKHLKTENMDLNKLAKKFLNLLQWRPFSLYDRKGDLEVLHRFTVSLSHLDQNVLESLNVAARKRLESRLRLGAESSDDGVFEFMNRSDGSHAQTFYDVVEKAAELRQLVEASRKDIETSSRTRRTLSVINMDSLQDVAVAARLWAQHNIADLPSKGIKETHALARFLADLFVLLEIDTSPTKAYDSWVAQT